MGNNELQAKSNLRPDLRSAKHELIDMREIAYKGFVIRAMPSPDSKEQHWGISILIMRDNGGELRTKSFEAGNTFSTENEAMSHCMNFGKQIIDGKEKNCSIADLM